MARETDFRVFVALINYMGQVLVVKRSQHTNNPGQIGLPGGHMDEGETYEQTAAREVREEIGLNFDFSKMSYMKVHADRLRTLLIVPLSSDRGYNLRLDPQEVETAQFITAVQLASLDDFQMHKSLRLAQPVLLGAGIQQLWDALSPHDAGPASDFSALMI